MSATECPATVLVVDDDEPSRFLTCRALRKAGYHVTEAPDGETALKTVAGSRPDLVILDMRLPGMDGLEVLRRLRRDPALAGLPIICFSAVLIEAPEAAVGLEAGGDAYLNKSVAPEVLLGQVRALLRVGRMQEELRLAREHADQRAQDAEQAEHALARERNRMELLAGTAEQLLAAPDPLRIVNDLCRKVMPSLDCQFFFNFLVDEEAGRLHLNAYAGISEETARSIEWLDYGVAVCGCAARDRCRIVAEHIPTTPDPRTELVKSFGVKAYACHPIKSAERVLGTLSFGTTTRETFAEDELSLMKAVTDQVAVAVVRRRQEQERERLQAELITAVQSRADLAERLYAEINHRMKNNLMLLSGVLQMQLPLLAAGSVAADALQDAIARITAVSVVHEQLYEAQSGDVEVQDVMRRVAETSAQALSTREVELEVSGDPCYVSSKLGSTLAILGNELLTNALKYGEPAGEGRLQVRVHLSSADGGLRLSIWNSGNPLPPDFDLQRQSGLGLDLVRGVVSGQLGGSFRLEAADGGTRAEIILPPPALRASWSQAEQTTPVCDSPARVGTR